MIFCTGMGLNPSFSFQTGGPGFGLLTEYFPSTVEPTRERDPYWYSFQDNQGTTLRPNAQGGLGYKQITNCGGVCGTPRTLDMEVQSSSLARRVVSLDKKLYSTLSLFTQVYKWVQATHCWGKPCDGLASRSGGTSNTLRHASYYGNRDKLQPFGPLAHVRLYPFYLTRLQNDWVSFLVPRSSQKTNVLLPLNTRLLSGLGTLYNWFDHLVSRLVTHILVRLN